MSADLDEIVDARIDAKLVPYEERLQAVEQHQLELPVGEKFS